MVGCAELRKHENKTVGNWGELFACLFLSSLPPLSESLEKATADTAVVMKVKGQYLALNVDVII